MIGLLLPLWLNLDGGGGPAPPAVFVAADTFSYHHSPPELSEFQSFETPEPPEAESIFVSSPEDSVFTGGDE